MKFLLAHFLSLYCFVDILAKPGPALITENVQSEDEARTLLTSLLTDVKNINTSDLESLVNRGYWTLAQEVVLASHKQNVDLSFAIRNGVKAVRAQADQLIRTLNPKFNEKQQVTPVYRWAQNDTNIFITIKYLIN